MKRKKISPTKSKKGEWTEASHFILRENWTWIHPKYLIIIISEGNDGLNYNRMTNRVKWGFHLKFGIVMQNICSFSESENRCAGSAPCRETPGTSKSQKEKGVDVRDVSLKVVHFVCACVCPCHIQVSGYHSWSHITDVSFVVVCCLNGCSCVSHPVHTWADGRFQFRWGNKIAGLVFKSRAVLWRFATKLWSYTHVKSFLSNVARFVFLWFLFNLSRCDI